MIAAGLRGGMYNSSFAFRNSGTLERGARFSTASFFETRISSEIQGQEIRMSSSNNLPNFSHVFPHMSRWYKG